MYYEAYRGQHGTSREIIHTRLPSITFSTMEAAYSYAIEPNNINDRGRYPTVLKARFRIDNPLFVSEDCFLELGEVAEKLGVSFAWEIAVRHEDYIYLTDNWWERFASKYGSVSHMMEMAPSLIDQLYLDAYVVLDDEYFVRWATVCGYDGAIHTGNGETEGLIEYRVFSKSQILKLEKVPLEACVAA